MAVLTLLAAIVATQAAGVPFRDPDHVAARRLALAGVLVLLLVALDIAVRAIRRSRSLAALPGAMRSVRSERWPTARSLAVGGGLVSFYLSYLAYRNLKSVVPLLRPGELFDRQLGDLDRAFFGGHDPGELLHTVLGTGISAQLLSAVYMSFFVFIPLSLCVALVFSDDLPGGLFFVTALSVNWAVGAASYFLLPSLGPIYAAPDVFADLATSPATHLQNLLLAERLEFLNAPSAAGAAQSIGAFASLHTSIVFTAAVAAHLLGARRGLKIALWGLVALTVTATIYLGWHYVADDLGGVVIAVFALAVARALTGVEVRVPRRAPVREASTA